jgi:sigma-B regulation protein RsbU (phosphoserine phosphatase)
VTVLPLREPGAALRPMSTSASITVGSDLTAVHFARTWAAWQLDVQLPWVPVDLLEDVELVISELVTNALRAACETVTLTVSHAESRVRVGVWDNAAGVPTLLSPTISEGHGRGLRIVAAVSDDWGVEVADDGKEVWAVLGVPAVTPDGSRARSRDVTASRVAERVPLDAVLGDQSSRTFTDALINDLLDQVRRTMSADTAAILLLDRSRQFLQAAAARGIEEEVRQGTRVRAGVGFAGRIAVERRPIVLDEVTPANVVNPLLLRRGIASMVGVPLLAEGDELLGVMHVGSLTPRTFSAVDVATVQRAAARAAQVLMRHRTFIDRAGSTALLQSLTPVVPDVRGLDLAARYVPGSQHGVGGDWYDVFVLPSGRIGVVIGDVMGHGLHAATIMGRLRSALRAYALEHDDPAEVITHLDDKLRHFEPGHIATVLYASLDLAGRRAHLCSAGHLPPILSRRTGGTRLVDASLGPPIGIAGDHHRTSASVAIPGGSLLCLYTDGLLDRRHDIDDELARLQGVLNARHVTDADGACAIAMAEMLADREAEDDVSLLTVLVND